jgi:hypothetical protein
MTTPSAKNRSVLARLGLAAGALIALGDLLVTMPALRAFAAEHWALCLGAALFLTSAVAFLFVNRPTEEEDRLAEHGEQWVLSEMRYYRSWLVRHAVAFSMLKILSLSCAAAIPVLAVVASDHALKLWAAALGAIVVFSESMLQVFRYQENWVNGAGTRGILERELARFRVGAMPYDRTSGDKRVALLVQRAVAAINVEYSTWSANLLRRQDTNGGPDHVPDDPTPPPK